MAIFLCAVKDNIKIVTLNSFGENCYFECIYNEKSIEIQALRRKSGAEPIPLFRETLRLDCFPNGPGAMLSFKQIFQTGSSLRMTFVGHKVNWGGPGPGQGTPLSLLSLATARHSENLRMVHWDFLLLPAPGCVHWDEGRHQGHSVTGPSSETESPAARLVTKLNANNFCFEMQSLIEFNWSIHDECYAYRMADKSLAEAGWIGGCPIPGPCQRRTIPTKTSQTLATPTWSCSLDSFWIMTSHWRLKTVCFVDVFITSIFENHEINNDSLKFNV